MTKEQRKAELLDWMISNCSEPNGKDYSVSLLVETTKRWLEIEMESRKDPYADDVFEGQCGSRLINLTVAHHAAMKTPIRRRDLRLSDMPHVSVFENAFGVGRMSIEYYKDVITEYGLTDKIT